MDVQQARIDGAYTTKPNLGNIPGSAGMCASGGMILALFEACLEWAAQHSALLGAHLQICGIHCQILWLDILIGATYIVADDIPGDTFGGFTSAPWENLPSYPVTWSVGMDKQAGQLGIVDWQPGELRIVDWWLLGPWGWGVGKGILTIR
ncbi:hypothetical protein EDD15DRAFT_2198357 [Pisolithus albus]|nr:hypothetical protein EDD15DRAFT_2198357 [Pisolithus albus]